MNREALHLCDGSKEIPLLATTLFSMAVVTILVEDIILCWPFIFARRTLRNAITPTLLLLHRDGDATRSTNGMTMLMATRKNEDEEVGGRRSMSVVGNFY